MWNAPLFYNAECIDHHTVQFDKTEQQQTSQHAKNPFKIDNMLTKNDEYHLISEEPTPTSSPNNPKPTKPAKPWVLTTSILAVICFLEFCTILKLLIFPLRTESFTTGFSTDFPDSTDAVILRQVRFTSPLKVDGNGTIYQGNQPGERHYTGDSPDVDQAWEDLMYGRYLRLRESEVDWLDSDEGSEKLERVPPQLIVPQGGMYGGIDMMHSLHCLNMLRKNMHGGGHMMMGMFSEAENKMHLGISHLPFDIYAN